MSASRNARGGSVYASRRVANEIPFRRPSGANADGAVTQRNVIPWGELEKKLAERLAAKAAAELGEIETATPPSQPPAPMNDVDAAPDSGVHASADEPPPSDLTYAVYTVKDLDARGTARHPRSSMAFAPTLPTSPARWAEVGKAAVVLLRSFWIHVRTSKPRPPLRDVCQVPFQLLLTELKISLGALPWKKIAVRGSVAVGSMLALVLVLMLAADATDDIKPASSAKTTAGSVVVDAKAQTIAAEPAKAAQVPAETIEIDDAPPAPPPKPATKAASPTKKAPAAKPPAEVFIP